MVIGSFASGSLLTAYGWSTVTALTLPPVVIAATALLWLTRARQGQAAA
jgi:lipopolysaccharide export LptBFGC system permease protein LptF